MFIIPNIYVYFHLDPNIYIERERERKRDVDNDLGSETLTYREAKVEWMEALDSDAVYDRAMAVAGIIDRR